MLFILLDVADERVSGLGRGGSGLFMFVEASIGRADVILIPGGSHPQLIERAAELYKSDYAKCLLPSGGFNPKIPEWKSEWEFLKDVAVKLAWGK